jgi:glutamate-1-semialdehyde 2,1-aminomutase
VNYLICNMLKKTTSKNLFAKAEKLMPGGVNSPVRAWNSVGGHPLFIAKGEGSKIVDADGNTYIDYVCSWGPLILGHADPEVIHAISEAAKLGTSYGAPNKLEIALAQRITKAMPSIEMIRFVNSGTEATMSAIRLARAYTKRDKIIKFIGGYHGHADFLLAKAGSGVATLSLPDSSGVPQEIAGTTLLAPYNNIEAVEKLFAAYKGQIAAIIVEPIAGNMGVVLPQKSFLSDLRKIADTHNTLLIFDEVITGFRVAWGGAQSLYGVEPDLTCLGKIIGGGVPVGAYGGKRKIMELIAPLGPVYQAGTLSGNPLAMAAGIATLDRVSGTKKAYAHLESLGAKLENGFIDEAKKAGIAIRVNRVGSMMTLFFVDHAITDFTSAKQADTKVFAAFFHGMIEHGVYLPPAQLETFFVSLTHTELDINKTIEKAAGVFQILSK